MTNLNTYDFDNTDQLIDYIKSDWKKLHTQFKVSHETIDYKKAIALLIEAARLESLYEFFFAENITTEEQYFIAEACYVGSHIRDLEYEVLADRAMCFGQGVDRLTLAAGDYYSVNSEVSYNSRYTIHNHPSGLSIFSEGDFNGYLEEGEDSRIEGVRWSFVTSCSGYTMALRIPNDSVVKDEYEKYFLGCSFSEMLGDCEDIEALLYLDENELFSLISDKVKEFNSEIAGEFPGIKMYLIEA